MTHQSGSPQRRRGVPSGDVVPLAEVPVEAKEPDPPPVVAHRLPGPEADGLPEVLAAVLPVEVTVAPLAPTAQGRHEGAVEPARDLGAGRLREGGQQVPHRDRGADDGARQESAVRRVSGILTIIGMRIPPSCSERFLPCNGPLLSKNSTECGRWLPTWS